jgi:type IV pilus assembly protein PilM
VPLPIEQVDLDWMVISEEHPRDDAFSRAESKSPVQAQLQDVMIIATEKRTATSYQATMAAAGLGASFYEVELFGAVRSSMRAGASLFIDIGASGSRLFAVNGRGIPVAVHPVALGGQAITESIMHALGWEFAKAEDAKRAIGLGKSAAYSHSENTEIVKAAKAVLSQVFAEGSRLIKEAANDHQVDVGRIELLGGSACLLGIKEAAAEHFGKDVEVVEPFAHVRKPIILEDVLLEVGPKFAVAAGLALRGLIDAKH